MGMMPPSERVRRRPPPMLMETEGGLRDDARVWI